MVGFRRRRARVGAALKNVVVACNTAPLWRRKGFTDIGALADCDCPSLRYWSKTGLTYAVDQARRRATRAGAEMLVEGAQTRLDAPSGDLTHALWVRNGGSSADTLVPLGDGVYRLTFASGAAVSFKCEIPTTIGTPYSAQMCAKLVSGTPSSPDSYFGLRNNLNAVPFASYAFSGLTSVEKYVSVTGDATHTGTQFVFRGDGEPFVIDVRFVQAEQSPYPTSWIPGPGNTRAQEDVRYTGSLYGASGCILIDTRPYVWSGAGETHCLYLGDESSSTNWMLVRNTDVLEAGREGSVLTASGIDWTDPHVLAHVWTPSGHQLYVDGTLADDNTYSGAGTPDNFLSIGWAYTGLPRPLNGRLGCKILPADVDATQIAAISADLLARIAE